MLPLTGFIPFDLFPHFFVDFSISQEKQIRISEGIEIYLKNLNSKGVSTGPAEEFELDLQSFSNYRLSN